MNYIPINIKTNYELLTSLIKSNDLISFLLQNKIDTIGITDSNMFSCMELYNKCKVNNIKLLIAVDLNEFNIYIYAKNYNGYISICNIVSKKNIDGITLDEILNFKDIIVVCNYDNYLKLKDKCETLFIGYSNKEDRDKCLKYTDNIVFNPQMNTFYEEDNEYLKYLYAIKNKKNINEVNVKYNNHYLKNVEEFEINTTIKFSKLIDIQIDKTKKHIPVYKENSYEYLKALSIKGLNKRLDNKLTKEYIERLKYELSVIKDMGFTDYFLIVYDYVLFAKKNNIMVGPGRGSAAGSLISYTLGITEIDPLKYGLIFERFLNPQRVTMPDIDVDFDNEKREEVINYVKEKYGYNNVGNIISFDTLLPKQVIRDVSKVLNLKEEKIDRLCKTINKEETFNDLKNNSEFTKYIKRNNDLTNLIKICDKLCGLKRNTSTHAAGIVISDTNLSNIMPMYKRDNTILTGYSMEYIEELGLLKMDFLSIKNLNTIFNIVSKINKDLNINIDLNKIPLNDELTLSLFKNANTSGIFQFESSGMINFLRKLKPDNFNTIIDAIALYRPSTMDKIDKYIENKRNPYKIKYLIDEIKPIVKDTYGILIYQEQVLELLRQIAGYSYAQADIIRRAMSKKKEDIILKERKNFLQRIIEKGYTLEIGNKLYDDVLAFAGYGFNKSHSVVYSLVAYQMAYLKAHYPLYFMTYLLNMNKSSDKLKEYINEAKTYNIQIENISINSSDKNFIIKNNKIIIPFTIIKNIAVNVSDEILEERRKSNFISFYDFMKRCYKNSVTKRIIISLIEIGAFDEFNLNRKQTINNFDVILNYINLCKDLDERYVSKPILEYYDDYNEKEINKLEIDNYGFYLSNHPVTLVNRYGNITLNDIAKYFNKNITCILLVENIKTIITKKGDKMCFVKLSDEYKDIEGVIFSNVYKRVYIEKGKIYKFVVKVEKEESTYKLIINNVIDY